MACAIFGQRAQSRWRRRRRGRQRRRQPQHARQPHQRQLRQRRYRLRQPYRRQQQLPQSHRLPACLRRRRPRRPQRMPAYRLSAFHACRHQTRLLERRPYTLEMPRPVCRRCPLCGTRPRPASLVGRRNHSPGRAGMRQTQQSPHLPHDSGLLACRAFRHLDSTQLVGLLPHCKRFGLALVSRFRALCHRDATRLPNRLRVFLAWQQGSEDPEPTSAQRCNGDGRGRSRISQQGGTDAIRVEPRQPL